MKSIALKLFAVLLCLTSGCAIFGVIASKFPQHNPPPYKALAGHTVGVMVWADRSVQIDWNNVRVDLAGAIEQYLKSTKADEMNGATFPVRPASIVRYQLDHPGTELSSVTDIAPELGVDRLIYIELNSLTTRAPSSVELFRGTASASLKVVEVSGKSARVAYEEHEIKAIFPKQSTSDGVLNGDDVKMYRGVLNLLAIKLGDRVVTHASENDEEDRMSQR